VMKKLSIPPAVSDAIADMRGGWLNMPPATLLDTLLMANQYAPVPSPLDSRREPLPPHGENAIDFVFDEATLADILEEAAETAQAMGGITLV